MRKSPNVWKSTRERVGQLTDRYFPSGGGREWRECRSKAHPLHDRNTPSASGHSAPIKVLVISQYFWPETFRITELARMLAEAGHEVTVLTGLPNYPDGEVFREYRADPSAFSSLPGIEIIRVPMVSRGTGRSQLAVNYVSFAASASTVGAWRLRRRAFDVIFVFEVSPVTVAFPAMLVRRIKRVPSCMLILDLWPETPQALGLLPNRALYRAAEWCVARIYRSTDLLLVQSPGFLPSVRRYAPDRAWVEYFPSWADAVFDSELPAPAPEVPPLAGGFTVVFAGNIGEAQDFGTVLAAAELLASRPDIRFLIVGDGRLSGWLADEVVRRGLQASFLLLGRHPLERMPEFFAHADALLVPLRSDPVFSLTIPAKVQAYMASGIPIVAVLDGEGAAAIRRWDCGPVVAPGDAVGLADAVLTLADAPAQRRRELGANGKKGVAEEFNRHSLMTQLTDWLSELATAGRTRR